MTHYEKRKKAAQEAAATRFSVGYWWNEQFEPQRVWLENAQFEPQRVWLVVNGVKCEQVLR
jgi:hypothetical protein